MTPVALVEDPAEQLAADITDSWGVEGEHDEVVVTVTRARRGRVLTENADDNYVGWKYLL